MLFGQSVSPNFGTTVTSTYSIGPCDAVVHDSNVTGILWVNRCAYVEAVNGFFVKLGFPVHLPTGALLQSVTTHYFDNDCFIPDFSGISAQFWIYDFNGAGANLATLSTGHGCTGAGSVTYNFDPPGLQIDNLTNSYAIQVDLASGGAGSTTAIYKFDVNYMLQVSPAPATATFGDVPTSSPQFQFVEALVSAGITAGCGGGNYCPNNPVTRGQMAVFLAKALGLNWPQ
jgi:hypothetical protein